MSEPCLLLVDEISMGLMPKLVAQVFQTLVQLKESGISVLLAEQKATEALAIADRGYVIENGRIMLSGQSTILLGDERVKTAYLGL
jgi:branched-chain amino acid transport system ATP-binding protein